MFDIFLRHIYVNELTFQDAIKQAKEEFSEELATIDDRQFCFTVAVTVQNQKQTVNISQRAWKTLMARLKQYEIIDITIRPSVVIQTADDVAPPQYTYGDEKHGETLSREPSPTHLDTGSQLPSRPGSPSLRSRAIGWIERRVGGSNDT